LYLTGYKHLGGGTTDQRESLRDSRSVRDLLPF